MSMNKLNETLTISEKEKADNAEDLELIQESIDKDINDREREKTRKKELILLGKIELILGTLKTIETNLEELKDRKLSIAERIRLEEKTKIGKHLTQQEYFNYRKNLYNIWYPNNSAEDAENYAKTLAKIFDVDGKDITIDNLLKKYNLKYKINNTAATPDHPIAIKGDKVNHTRGLNSNSDISSSESNLSSSAAVGASQPKSTKLTSRTSVKKTPNLEKSTNRFTRFFGKFGRKTTGGAYTLKKRKH